VVFLKSVSNECDNLSEIYKKKLESLHELKQSILQKAFNGELT
jgi:type I restriction enzyme S subunit